MAEGSKKKLAARKAKTSRKRSMIQAEREARKRKPPAVHNPDATLLAIPGELPNKIYRLALWCSDGIPITLAEHKQPGILSVNHQTCREAMSIFLEENDFYIRVANLRPYYLPNSHWATKIDYTLWFDPRARKMQWSHLRKWLLKAFDDPQVPRLDVPRGYSERITWLTATIKMVGKSFELLAGLERMNGELRFDLTWDMVESGVEA